MSIFLKPVPALLERCLCTLYLDCDIQLATCDSGIGRGYLTVSIYPFLDESPPGVGHDR